MSTPAPAAYSDDWRNGYSRRRYLEFLSFEDLDKRYVDLLDNVLAFTTEGKSHLDALTLDNGWTQRIADLWSEVSLRALGSSWLRNIEQTALNRPYPKAKRAIEVWGDRVVVPDRCIVKYGRSDHMQELLRGRIRLTPASEYHGSSNPAIRDAELEFAVHAPSGTKILMKLDEAGTEGFNEIPTEGLITLTRRCKDYFVFCCSAAFVPQAFDDFGYNACVLIHDWQKLIELIKPQRVPARALSSASTIYIDPYFPYQTGEYVERMKHFRFAYQREWRILWTDPIPPLPLEPYFLELGDLSSFCELITLGDT